MSHQGERPTGHEDDWWGQLYDDSTEDTGPAAVADSLDDRFASAAGTVGPGAAPGVEPPERDVPPPPAEPPAVPEQRGVASGISGPWPGATPFGDGPSRSLGRRERDEPPEPRLGHPPRGDVPGASTGPPQRGGPARQPAPWEPSRPDPSRPDLSAPDLSAPGTFPPGPTPPGFRAENPRGLTPTESPVAPGPAPWTPADAPPRPTTSPRPTTAPPDASTAAPPPTAPPSDAPPGAVPRRTDASGTVAPRPDSPRPDSPRRDALRGDSSRTDSARTDSARTDSARTDSSRTDSPRDDVPPPDAPRVSASAGTAAPRDASSGVSAPPPYALPAPDGPSPSTRPDLPLLPALVPRESVLTVSRQPPAVDYVGSGPPTYDAEPTALPPADPDDLDDLVADTVLDGARYGAGTLRAVSVRGDSARYRGEPRRDALLTARFGAGEQALVLVAMATGARATPGAHRAAAEACQWIGRAVGRSHARLAEDIRAARRGDLKSGLHRLTDRSLGKLRASAAEQGIEPEEYTASLRCLLFIADPECRTRVFFGVGAGGLFRLRDGEWQDIEPRVTETTGEAVVGFGSLPHETPEGDRFTMDLGITTPPSPYEPAPEPARDPFRFRASVARPGDTLLLCTGGLAEPLRGEPQLAAHLTTRWSAGEPPGLAAFLADTQVRVKGYADDRTAAAVWEA
ncbi:protein phosphatase 2C domain-containing protein [Streptomyces sp. NPDC048275]|uniref:protein phosphatase 2C domain-containing protein n=1 Tax=Streptomyces sp. NPDC048275 TaxID=3155629 RepID=UPI0033FEF5B3